jgi:hypothetical protein
MEDIRVVVRKVQKPTACPGRCEKNRSLASVPDEVRVALV